MDPKKAIILELFVKDRQLRFCDILERTGLRSNLLSYHLNKLVEEGILLREDDLYRVAKDHEHVLAKFAQVSGKEKGPLAIVVAAIYRDGNLCLLRRSKRPYKGYWGLIGGKIRLEESVRETALREAVEETGLSCRFEKVCAVLHERVREGGQFKHAFIIFLCRLSADDGTLKPCDEGELDWFSSLPPKIIPSDRYMVDNLLDEDGAVFDVIIEDEEDRLVDMVLERGGVL